MKYYNDTKIAMELLGDKDMTLPNHWRDPVPYEHWERTLDTLMTPGNQRSHQEIF